MMEIKILPQPDDTTCGPTSLHAVYNYYGENISLNEVISNVTFLEEGGTLAVLLGIDALKKGYDVSLLSYNLVVFDPTWFADKTIDIKAKLNEQLKYKKKPKLIKASKAYIEFLDLGGKILFKDLNAALLKKYFDKNVPLLTGLNATYLYNCARETVDVNDNSVYDDIKGYSAGHFVVLCGYDEEKKNILVSDPYKGNPISENNYYSVRVGHLINSILLGIVTYDANLLIIEKQEKK